MLAVLPLLSFLQAVLNFPEKDYKGSVPVEMNFKDQDS